MHLPNSGQMKWQRHGLFAEGEHHDQVPKQAAAQRRLVNRWRAVLLIHVSETSVLFSRVCCGTTNFASGMHSERKNIRDRRLQPWRLFDEVKLSIFTRMSVLTRTPCRVIILFTRIARIIVYVRTCFVAWTSSRKHNFTVRSHRHARLVGSLLDQMDQRTRWSCLGNTSHNVKT